MESAAETPTLTERLHTVQERISNAAHRAGRDPSSILLLAVTKIFPPAVMRAAYELGIRDFGENYVQEFEAKVPEVGALPGARFHLIGHLQSNKAKKASDLFDAVQTVDSPKLGRRLDECGKLLSVMIEVKLSLEDAKHGATEQELPALVDAIRACSHLRLTGLMTMPPWSENAEDSRPYFRQLRNLAEGFGLRELSMGMSHDLEVAIEEGATCVRVGTALFGKRRKP